MAVDVHTYLVLCAVTTHEYTEHLWLSDKCNARRDYELVLTGCSRVHLPVAWELSRDQVMTSPTLITLLSILSSLLLPFSPFFSSSFGFSLLFASLEINVLFPQWPQKSLSNNIFSSSPVIFTDTSIPPLLFSSPTQEPRYSPFLSGCEPRSLIYTSSGTTQRRDAAGFVNFHQ